MNDQLTPNDLARELGTTGRAVREILRKKYGKLQPPETRWRLDESQAQYVRATFASERTRSKQNTSKSPDSRMDSPGVVTIADVKRSRPKPPHDDQDETSQVNSVLGDEYAKSVLDNTFGKSVFRDTFGKSVVTGAIGGPALTAAFSGVLSTSFPAAVRSGIAEGILEKLNESTGMRNLGPSLAAQWRNPAAEAMVSGLRQQISLHNTLAGVFEKANAAASLPSLANGILVTSSGIAGWKGIGERISPSFSRQWTASLLQPSFENALRRSLVADVLANSLVKTAGFNAIAPSMQQAVNGIAKSTGLSDAVAGILNDAAVRSAFSGIGKKIVDEWIQTVQEMDRAKVDEEFEDHAERWASALTERAPAVDALADNQELVRRGFQFSRLRRMPTSRAGKLTLAWLAFWTLLNLLVIGMLVDPTSTLQAVAVATFAEEVGRRLYKWADKKPAQGRLSDEARAQIDKMNDDTKGK